MLAEEANAVACAEASTEPIHSVARKKSRAGGGKAWGGGGHAGIKKNSATGRLYAHKRDWTFELDYGAGWSHLCTTERSGDSVRPVPLVGARNDNDQ